MNDKGDTHGQGGHLAQLKEKPAKTSFYTAFPVNGPGPPDHEKEKRGSDESDVSHRPTIEQHDSADDDTVGQYTGEGYEFSFFWFEQFPEGDQNATHCNKQQGNSGNKQFHAAQGRGECPGVSTQCNKCDEKTDD